MPESSTRHVKKLSSKPFVIQCVGGGCKRTFLGVTAYDRHAFPEGCGTDAQLKERGLRLDRDGRWVVA